MELRSIRTTASLESLKNDNIIQEYVVTKDYSKLFIYTENKRYGIVIETKDKMVMLDIPQGLYYKFVSKEEIITFKLIEE